jgi:BBSome-interacting protein 1
MANAPSEILIQEVLPKYGLLFTEQSPMPVLCKPKIMPLKSVTLEKLEKMQKDAQETIKRQEEQEKAAHELNNSEDVDEHACS